MLDGVSGLSLLREALLLLCRRRGVVLRVMAFPCALAVILIASLAAAALFHVDVSWPNGAGSPEEGSLIAAALATAAVVLVTLSWICVAWHRHVLAGERLGLPPRFLPGPVLMHLLGMGLLGLGLALLAAATALGTGLVLILFPEPVVRFVTSFAIWALAIWAGLRLSPMLPTLALGGALAPQRAWAATRPLSGEMAGAAVILSVAQTVLTSLSSHVLRGTLAGGLLSALVFWGLPWLLLSLTTVVFKRVRTANPARWEGPSLG